VSHRLFVTGTDTGVGKTAVSAGLLRAWGDAGYRTAGMKPVASGCARTGDGLRNADALALMAAMTEPAPYEAVNPVALEPAIAPHIAAGEAGVTLDAHTLAAAAGRLPPADLLVVEGAGGWRVPLGPEETFADIARHLRAEVVLVVGIRLGCINHALLTAEAVHADGLALAGWVACCVEPAVDRREAQLATLAQRMEAPCLGIVPYLGEVAPAAVAGILQRAGGVPERPSPSPPA